MAWLDGPAQPFDVVFLDPPFRQGMLPAVCERLADGWLAPQARVYLESESGSGDADELPPGWTLLRERAAGQVRYRLVTPSA